MVDTHKEHEDDVVVAEEETSEVSDDVELEDSELSMNDKIKSLRQKLRACEEEKQIYLTDTQRARADFLNSRRRLEEQLDRDRERATDKILLELLTLADSFDIAISDTQRWETLDGVWRDGIMAINAKLLSILKDNNVSQVNPLGEPFNPEAHDAVSSTQVEDIAQVDTVVSVLQKGYKRGDIVLRPARVCVGVGK